MYTDSSEVDTSPSDVRRRSKNKSKKHKTKYVSSSDTKYKSKSKKIKHKNKSGLVAKASDYVVNPQIWPHTARIDFAFLLGE